MWKFSNIFIHLNNKRLSHSLILEIRIPYSNVNTKQKSRKFSKKNRYFFIFCASKPPRICGAAVSGRGSVGNVGSCVWAQCFWTLMFVQLWWRGGAGTVSWADTAGILASGPTSNCAFSIFNCIRSCKSPSLYISHKFLLGRLQTNVRAGDSSLQ